MFCKTISQHMTLCRSQFELDRNSQFIVTNTSKVKGNMKCISSMHYNWWLWIKLNTMC